MATPQEGTHGSDSAAAHSNRLATETSPYLLQHARNPVDWYPWGTEALETARRERKPILLSIGYSACHWCHVMAHESFEDADTARLMNSLFVNIKVDREERPDLDRIYQIAHQMLTQRGGGWPLTMFLSPEDQRPFFGGTYFPDSPRYGMPSFRELLQRVADYYAERGDEIRAQNTALAEAFAELLPAPADPSSELSDAPLRAARADLAQQFDRSTGGFGGAPRFPHPTTLDRLLRDWRASAGQPAPDLQALYMATLTLARMAEGGLFDQIGGGFARYSVDAQWMIPHFEKMLYDNGALLATYAQAALATGDPFFARVAQQTADWIVLDMQSPDGGYYSSLDADSEGHEGLFYVWTPTQVQALLSPEQYAAFAPRYGLDRAPNFEDRYWHLHTFRSLDELASDLGVSAAVAGERIDAARGRLLAARRARIWPGRDDKILTSWNAIAIRGMAMAARTLRRADLADSATRALDYLRRSHWRDGRLLATSRDGRAQLPAYLDDYALLADAILELAQVRWSSAEILFARDLLEVLLRHFEDARDGGFFFTADDHEQLMHRSKSFADDATPSGNAVAAFALARFGALLGEPRYLDASERVLRAGWQSLQKYPHGHTSLLTALEEWLQPPEIVVLRGAAPVLARWQQELGALYAPRRLLLAIPEDAVDLPAALASKPPRGDVVAYICQGMTCSPPIESLAALARHFRLGLDAAASVEIATRGVS